MRQPRLVRAARSLAPHLVRAGRIAAAAAAVLLGLAGLGWALLHEQLIDETRFARPLDALIVTDRGGRPLRVHRPSGGDTVWVARDDVPEHVVRAFLAAEDQRFEEHAGIDGLAVLRALVGNATGARLSGASTITQQLVKLVYGRPNGLWDKPLEIARALELERRMTKDEILEQYLNRVPMGGGIVGVARAAEVYFGHPLAEVTLAEAALLAGIPQAPSRTEPRRHARRARARRDYVLDRLEALGWVSAAEADAARATPVVTASAPPRPWEAPRFVDRVLSARRSHGAVRTSLDLSLQHDAESALRDALAVLSPLGAENGAAVVLDPRTGELLAYVGAARDGAGDPGGALDLLRARRQPGSTLKPFAYELFFEDGAGPATLVDDVRTPMRLGDGTSFVARDFDGRERGPVRARVALSASLNLAAIDVVRRVGPERFVERLEALGFSRAERADSDAAALVLGGIDVTALELARAYALLAHGGRPVAPTMLARERAETELDPVLDPVAVALLRDVLEDGAARADAFGASLEDEAGGPFALKTGTSAGFHDAWCVAFDDEAVVVVWIGSPARRAMDGVSGFRASAPVAARILGAARARRPDGVGSGGAERDDAPALASVEVCALSGALPGPGCAHRVIERFAAAHVPHAGCPLHGGGAAIPPARAAAVLPARYADWAARHPELDVTVAAPSAPLVRSPSEGAVLMVRRSAPLVPVLTSGAERVELDGRPVTGELVETSRGAHELVAIGPSGRRTVHFTVEYAD